MVEEWVTKQSSVIRGQEPRSTAEDRVSGRAVLDVFKAKLRTKLPEAN